MTKSYEQVTKQYNDPLKTTSFCLIHIDLEKCIVDLQKSLSDATGQDISKKDVSKVLADHYKNKCVRIEVLKPTSKRKRPQVNIVLF